MSPPRRRIALYDATAPVVCTLHGGEVRERRDELEWLRSKLRHVDRTEHGLLLHLAAGDDVEVRVRHFVEVEQRCCAFWGFEVAVTRKGTTLRWDAPPAADPIVADLLAWFRREPGADVADLL